MARKNTPSYVIELRVLTNESNYNLLLKRLFLAEKLYNNIVCYARKQLKRMRENKRYKQLLREYIVASKKQDKRTMKLLAEQLNLIKLSYGLTKYQLEAFAYNCNEDYHKHLDSDTRSKISYRVSEAVDKVMYGNGKELHFKKHGTLMSLEGKKNTNGIRYKDGFFIWGKKVKIRTKFRKDDLYIQEAMLDRIKYCRIVKKPSPSGYEFYLQLIMEGEAPAKRNKDGSFRKSSFPGSVGRVGIDLGTSTIAVASDSKVILTELAPNTKEIDVQIARLSRKLDRSRRATNPDNFNEDGTVKKDTKNFKKKWARSKNYLKTLYKIKALYAKKARLTKQFHCHLVNTIKQLGNEFYYEKVSVEGLKRRAKKTERSEKVSIVNNKEVQKYKRKKRFGKSAQTYAPADFINKLETKLKQRNQKLTAINLKTFRASQYNHLNNTYKKKKLHQRHTKIGDDVIQRDLYSAFLLKNASNDLASPNRELCLQTYNDFKILHNELMHQYRKEKQEGRKFLTCMGI